MTVDHALAWHELAITRHGGSPGLRDPGLLDSAIAQPRQTIAGAYAYPFPFGMAAAYALNIVKNPRSSTATSAPP